MEISFIVIFNVSFDEKPPTAVAPITLFELDVALGIADLLLRWFTSFFNTNVPFDDVMFASFEIWAKLSFSTFVHGILFGDSNNNS
ncbi:hypothetical protein DERF_009617 [Dermatophagoides farinae]|uniref:Uncharacterized protein n=1 Tax=Dermatophagoides farinae TaxID=6954 RepID=A0A922HUB6_DERFA|nr:hypothetical protein DERF_009617 [Dermatophagoides farinae]